MVSEEAVNAAAEALWIHDGYDNEPAKKVTRNGYRAEARAALDAALPHIRQELAAEIESEVERLVRSMGPGDADQGYFDAARIVRGETDE